MALKELIKNRKYNQIELRYCLKKKLSPIKKN